MEGSSGNFLSNLRLRSPFYCSRCDNVNLESLLKTFSYFLGEEIELLEAIYIHELTLEGPRER